MVNGIGNRQISEQRAYIAAGVSEEFEKNIFQSIENLTKFSSASNQAISNFDNVIILKNADSDMPDSFTRTQEKLDKYARDAFGFVSKSERAIVLVEDNHKRKNTRLEGDVVSQGGDTITHEIGHLLDKEYSTTNEFKEAYLQDLKAIHSMLQDENAEVCGENLEEMIVYLKHYIEGVNFEDGIDETDITREGLRENFAECFSTLADSNPTKINEIYSTLFPHTMEVTRQFVA
ncbi:hypothetical protein IJ182_11050 [bacterium]|nr:hypothetical protein [bacterium]